MTCDGASSLKTKGGATALKPPRACERIPRPRALRSAEDWVDGIVCGERTVLAKAITLIESSRPADCAIAGQIVERCMGAGADSIRVGITGVPGAGKSTLIESLGKLLISERGERVAVLAIDPTSRISGGSILGDKTRMPFLASSDMAFIRPSPSRGVRGGVAQHTREAIIVCEAAGYRNILIETVGIGQSEVTVRDLVDFVLLVTLPGAGDELQGLKRGVMEIVDAVVINKADGENVRAAARARTEGENALHFLHDSGSGWTPRALACSAQTGRGIADLWACILEHAALTRKTGWFERNRREQNQRCLHEKLEQALMHVFRSDPAVQQQLLLVEQQVLNGQITVNRAVRELLEVFDRRRS